MTEFTSLGSDVDSEGYSTPENHRLLGKANSIMGQLDAVWKQKRLNLQTKLRLYISLTLYVLLYEEDFGAPVSAAYDAAQDLSISRLLRPSGGHARQ